MTTFHYQKIFLGKLTKFTHFNLASIWKNMYGFWKFIFTVGFETVSLKMPKWLHRESCQNAICKSNLFDFILSNILMTAKFNLTHKKSCIIEESNIFPKTFLLFNILNFPSL